MDEEVFSCKTQYTVNLLKKFNRYVIYSRISTKIEFALAVILFLCAVGLNINGIVSLIMLIISILVLLAIALVPKMAAKQTFENSYKTNKTDVEAKFYDDKIKIITYNNDEKVSEQDYNYSQMIRIINNKKCLYLYLTENQVFICDTKKSKGEYRTLVKNLREKMGKKYKERE